MYLKLDDKRLSSGVDEQSILSVLRDAASSSQAFVAIHRSVQDFLQVALGTDQPLTLLRVEEGQEQVVVPDPSWPLEQVAQLFSRYAADDPAWQDMTSWSQNYQERAVADAMARGRLLLRKLAAGAVVLVLVLLAGAVVFGDLPVVGALKLLAAFAAFGAYLRWIHYAAFTLRPGIARKLGESFSVALIEGGDMGFGTSGMWELEGEAPLAVRIALPIIDLSVVLTLFFGPFALGLPALIFVLNGFQF